MLAVADGLHRSTALQKGEGGKGSQHRGLDVMGKGGDHIAAKIRLPQSHLDRDALTLQLLVPHHQGGRDDQAQAYQQTVDQHGGDVVM